LQTGFSGLARRGPAADLFGLFKGSFQPVPGFKAAFPPLLRFKSSPSRCGKTGMGLE
jgi:hypothetical protein